MINLNDGAGSGRRLVRVGVLQLIVAGLTACGGHDFSDLKTYISEVKSRPSTGIDPLPEFIQAESFVFKADGLRNPFTPAPAPEIEETDAGGSGGIHPDFSRPREELEAYTLDSLRMVGTVLLNGVKWGLVKATDGTIHRVRVGNYLGRNYGKILRIHDDRIEVREIVPDTRPGRWLERQASLALSE